MQHTTYCTEYPFRVRKAKISLACLRRRPIVTKVPIRVLIADDSELIRQQVRKILESDQQIEVCAEAQDGAEAVRMARQCRPDLVLMDVFMPEMSGLEAVYEIKRATPNLPVVVFTIYDSGDLRVESRNAGADAFVLKAKGSVELLPTIHKLLPSPRVSAQQRGWQA